MTKTGAKDEPTQPRPTDSSMEVTEMKNALAESEKITTETSTADPLARTITPSNEYPLGTPPAPVSATRAAVARSQLGLVHSPAGASASATKPVLTSSTAPYKFGHASNPVVDKDVKSLEWNVRTGFADGGPNSAPSLFSNPTRALEFGETKSVFASRKKLAHAKAVRVSATKAVK
jgi:hypothetical protein